MALCGRGLDDGRASAPRARLNGIGVHAEESQLGAEPSPLVGDEALMPRVLVVGVIGVKHQLHPADLDGGEIGIRIVDRSAKHIAVEEGALSSPVGSIKG